MMDRKDRLRTAAAIALAGGLALISTAVLAQNTVPAGKSNVAIQSGGHVQPPNLGRLSAAHAALTGKTAATSDSAVSQMYSYQQAKADAVALPADTPAQRQARSAAMARADALLELIANKPLSAQAIAQVDMMLGIDTATRASN